MSLQKREIWPPGHTQESPCEGGGRDRGDVSTSQGAPQMASEAPEAGERPGPDAPSRPQKGAHPANTSILTRSLQTGRQ